MASDFQYSKVARVFEAMDADGDGYLTEADFRALTTRWITLRGNGDNTRLTEVMMGWWTTLREAAGTDEVTIDEVLAVVDQLKHMPQAVADTADAMFEAVDENADGRISQAEYRQLVEAWNGRHTETAEAFALLDLNHDGYLSRSEFTEHWTEFWAGDNPDAPGSWVFGLFPADAGRD
ncbi:MAG TPA: EF-hand domain-containing protein [Streptosporangiaceae bacterium]|jgi:Ca2+-binding EF-hand superfamily protein